MGKIITDTNQPIADIRYFMEVFTEAPITLYVVRGRDGDMLIDTGFIWNQSKLLKWITINEFHITDILLTHAHPDHDWNATKLSRHFNARIWMGAEDVGLIRNFMSQEQLPLTPNDVKKAHSSNYWGSSFLFKSKQYQPQVVITEDGNNVAQKYGYDISVVKLPGHTDGSLGVLANGVLYCGDTFATLHGVPSLPPHVASYERMKKTWRKMLDLAPAYLAPGHGMPMEMVKAEKVLEEGTDMEVG